MKTTRGSQARRGTGLELVSLAMAAALILSCGKDGGAGAAAQGGAEAAATLVRPQADIDAAWAQAQTIAVDMYSSNKTAVYNMFHDVPVSTQWYDWTQDSLSYMNGVMVSTSDFETRLGIRELRLLDGPVTCGGSNQGCTIFPAPIAVASTWDVDQAVAMYTAQGAEKKAKGANVSLSPTMNIVRDPRGGRNFETFSEDPYLSAQLAASAVTGIQSNHIIATSKHYVDNDQETNRNTVIVSVDERTQHEIYLAPFKAAIQAGTGAVMCSYNQIANPSSGSDYACENAHQLKDLLKGELGFRGFVMSDWGATHSGAKAANNGLDVEMNDNKYFASLNGQITDATAQEMARRIVFAHLITGLNTNPVTKITKAQGVNTKVVSTAANQQLAQATAEQAIVLLKNSGVLPLSKTATNIAVFGECAESKYQFQGGGSASGDTTGKTIVTPRQAIANALGVAVGNVPYGNESNVSGAVSLATGKAAAIVVLCQMSQEGNDRGGINFGSSNSNSNANSDSMVTQIAATGTPTIVMTVGPAAVGMPWASNANVKAILWSGLLGETEGPAIARVLFGDVNPSGKLPVTFGASLADYPTQSSVYGTPSDLFPGGSTVYYKEGLNVGYRHFDARNITPLYPFGHGLSYTTFGYANLAVTPSANAATNDSVTVELDLTNSGTRAGAEVVQVYVGYPTAAGEPPKVLKGFKKVSLAAGAMQHVAITLGPDAYQIWNNAWTPVVGTYQVMVGSSSRDLRLTGSFVVNTSSLTMWPLTVTKSGAGTGTVTSTPAGVSCGATCSPTFQSGTVVTLSAAAASGSQFAGWSGACSGTAATCTVTMSAAQSVGAAFDLVQTSNTLTVTKGGSGSGTVSSSTGAISCGTTCSASIASGTVITLTAAADASSTFSGWSGACSGSAATCVVTVTAAQAVTATFTLNGGTATLLSQGKPATASSTESASYPASYAVDASTTTRWSSAFSDPQWLQVDLGQTASITKVVLTWESAYGKAFQIQVSNDATTWTSIYTTTTGTGGTQTLAVSGSGRYVRMYGTARATAYGYSLYDFQVWGTAGQQTTAALTVSTLGTGLGTVTSAPAGISCGATCSASYATGTLVTLTATPDAASSSTFGGWSGACSGTAATCVVTLSQAQSVTATFNPPSLYSLTVTKAGGGTGTVTSSAGGINCGSTCTASLSSGVIVTLTATASSGMSFGGWSGACTGTGTCVVTMTGNQAVTATFNQQVTTYPLTVTKAGTGSGTVTANTGGISCGTSCTASLAAGTVVNLTTAAASGSVFAGWSGDCSGSSCSLGMDGPKSVTATFNLVTPSYTLTVSKSGTGTGTVTSSVGGISCGAACSASLASGTIVTLTASADASATFTGWSGACTGTAPTCAVTMSAAQTATAAFTANTTTTPCANPVTFTSNTNNFNTTGAVCYRTSQAVNGWGCSNFTGRNVSVNGGTATATCGAGPFPLPKWSDGYTYFSATAGSYAWASIYIW
jgi:beta-glucosidase